MQRITCTYNTKRRSNNKQHGNMKRLGNMKRRSNIERHGVVYAQGNRTSNLRSTVYQLNIVKL